MLQAWAQSHSILCSTRFVIGFVLAEFKSSLSVQDVLSQGSPNGYAQALLGLRTSASCALALPAHCEDWRIIAESCKDQQSPCADCVGSSGTVLGKRKYNMEPGNNQLQSSL